MLVITILNWHKVKVSAVSYLWNFMSLVFFFFMEQRVPILFCILSLLRPM